MDNAGLSRNGQTRRKTAEVPRGQARSVSVDEKNIAWLMAERT